MTALAMTALDLFGLLTVAVAIAFFGWLVVGLPLLAAVPAGLTVAVVSDVLGGGTNDDDDGDDDNAAECVCE